MIILYVPFKQDQSGDLSVGANLWQDHVVSTSGEKVDIVYHQDDIDEKTIDFQNTIYILAHGYSDGMNTTLINHASKETQTITPEELASRFQMDFTFMISKIKDIHIYCCGELEKNKKISQEFHAHLLNTEYSNIHYYWGTIYAPDKQGLKYSFTSNKYLPVHMTRTLLPRSSHKLTDNDQTRHRIPVKQLIWHHFEEKCRQKRVDSFMKMNKQKREACIKQRRKNFNESQNAQNFSF